MINHFCFRARAWILSPKVIAPHSLRIPSATSSPTPHSDTVPTTQTPQVRQSLVSHGQVYIYTKLYIGYHCLNALSIILLIMKCAHSLNLPVESCQDLYYHILYSEGWYPQGWYVYVNSYLPTKTTVGRSTRSPTIITLTANYTCHLGTLCMIWWFATLGLSDGIHAAKYPCWDLALLNTLTQTHESR